MPDSIAEVEFYVLPYMKGAEVLERSGEMSSLQVIQTLTAGGKTSYRTSPMG